MQSTNGNYIKVISKNPMTIEELEKKILEKFPTMKVKYYQINETKLYILCPNFDYAFKIIHEFYTCKEFQCTTMLSHQDECDSQYVIFDNFENDISEKEIYQTFKSIPLCKPIAIEKVSPTRAYIKFLGTYKYVISYWKKCEAIFGIGAKHYLEKRGFHAYAKIPTIVTLSKPLVSFFEQFGDLIRFQPVSINGEKFILLGYENEEDMLTFAEEYTGDIFNCGENVYTKLLFNQKEDFEELQIVINNLGLQQVKEKKKEERIIKQSPENCSQYNFIVTLPKHVGRDHLNASLINIGKVISFSEGYDLFFGRYALVYISKVENPDALCNFDFGVLFIEKFTGLVSESLERGRLRQKQLKEGKTTLTVRCLNQLAKSRKEIHRFYRQFGRILFIDYDGDEIAEIMFYQELALKLALQSQTDDYEIIPNKPFSLENIE